MKEKIFLQPLVILLFIIFPLIIKAQTWHVNSGYWTATDALNRPTPTENEVGVTKSEKMVYRSGNVAYVEDFSNGMLKGRFWTSNGKLYESKYWESDAFEIRIKTEVNSPDPDVPGKLLSSGWRLVDRFDVPTHDKSRTHSCIKLEQRDSRISVVVHTLVDGTALITRWLDIINTGEKPIALTSCFPWTGRLWYGEGPAVFGGSYKGGLQWEGWFQWKALKNGMNDFSSLKGIASDDPNFIIRNEDTGEYFFGMLAYSANYIMQFEKSSYPDRNGVDPGVSFRIGPTSRQSIRIIAPGEAFTTPAVHMGCVDHDFDGAVQAIHEHVRHSVLPKQTPNKSYLVQCLLPEDEVTSILRGDECNEANLRKFLDVCQAAGVELFILDGPDWAVVHGNWVPKKSKFPNGLVPLVEYAHSKGILFGLYAEPEGGRPRFAGSQFVKDHPDWSYGSNYELNLQIPEASHYMENEICRIIDEYKLDLYRHDFNSVLMGENSCTERNGFTENDYMRHQEQFDSIFDRIRLKYPNVILQQASYGGCRLDLGTVSRFHEQFATDICSYPKMFQMISGMSVFLPPETNVFANGMGTIEQPDFVTLLRSAYCCGNTPMLFNTMLNRMLVDIGPEKLELLKRYNKLYKEFIRPMYPNFKVWHHAPVNATGDVESGDWFAMEFTSPDKIKGWATIINLAGKDDVSYLLKPRGLDEELKYKVTFDNTGKTQVVSGATLMDDGLKITIPVYPRSELVLFEKN